MSVSTRNWFKPVFYSLIAFIIAYSGGWAYRWQQENQNIVSEYSAYTGGDFTLQSPEGEVSLHDYQGRVVLLYFGYTYCPDVCPTSLAVMGEAMGRLEEEHQVKGLLISIDPERDTLDKLRDYAPYFHSEMTGLAADEHRLLEVATRYGAYYQKVEREEKDYLMDHTSRIYLIDQRGKLSGVIGHGATPQEVVERVRELL